MGESFWRAFTARYHEADFEWVRKQKEANPDLDIEWLATKSHNATLQASIDKSLAQIRRYKADFHGSLDDSRDDAILRSELRRDNEIETADRKRRAAWAAALQEVARGLQAASRSASAIPAASYSALQKPDATGGHGSRLGVPSGCTSDFSCGIGKKCVKQFYKLTGVCMQVVNEYGMPTYEVPDIDSLGPNMPSKARCTIGTLCPLGFRCDFGSGVCVR